jgi:DNA-binding PadR family transcriptional regulator
MPEFKATIDVQIEWCYPVIEHDFYMYKVSIMTDAELAILSILTEGPSYDHDLNKIIDSRGLRRWTAIGASSMYYVLDKLEKQGLVQMTPEADGRRRFYISPAGTGVLQTAVVDLLSTPHAHDKSFELGLVNLHVLRSSQVRSALQSREQDLVAQINKLRETLAEELEQHTSYQAESLFSHRLRMMEAELVWLEEFISYWEKRTTDEQETVIAPAIIPRNRQVVLPHDPDSVHKQETVEIPSEKKHTPLAKSTKDLMRPVNKTGEHNDSNEHKP